MRKLATIRTVSSLDPIPDADTIEVATVDGWKVVVKRGEYKVGQLALYLEIDSWVPHELAAFLSKGQEPRVYEGVRGEKLRTIRLRGTLSQGLLLPLESVFKLEEVNGEKYLNSTLTGLISISSPHLKEMDFAPLLGIKKWEAEISAQLAGQVKGNFPSFIRKTDQERCQNLYQEIFVDNKDALYEVTTKLDGSSCTIYYRDGELGVCSRNLELKTNEENKDNSLVRAMYENKFDKSLLDIGKNVAIQGEIMGPGIQGNREQLKKSEFYIFDIYDIDSGGYMNPAQRMEFIDHLRRYFKDVKHVPILHSSISLEELQLNSIDDLLAYAEGPSLVHKVREGVVFKRLDGQFSFKAISNKFLANQKE